jgi:hypothetical protein
MKDSNSFASENDKPLVFVSYSTKDRYFVEFIEKICLHFHIPIWVDHIFLNGGDKFPDQITQNIQFSKYTLLMWSKDAAASEWVKREILISRNSLKRIIPCILDNTPLPKDIEDLNHIDFRNDIEIALSKLLNSIGIEYTTTPILKEYILILFSKILLFKTGSEFPEEMKIPGLILRNYENKLIRWKNEAFSSSLGIIGLSRNFIQTNYSKDLESLFRLFLKENGWEYKPLSCDHDGELVYRAMTSCTKGNNTFAYVFTAQQKNDDWDNQLFILEVDHHYFFNGLLKWIESYNEKAILICDDFKVSIYNPPMNKTYYNQELPVALSFCCDLGYESHLQGIHWFEQMLPLFTEFLTKNEYTITDIGVIKQPVFFVTNKDNMYNPKHDCFLFEAVPTGSNKKRFKFVYECENVARGTPREQGYSEISIITG